MRRHWCLRFFMRARFGFFPVFVKRFLLLSVVAGPGETARGGLHVEHPLSEMTFGINCVRNLNEGTRVK